MNVGALDTSGAAIVAMMVLVYVAWASFVVSNIVREARAGDTRESVAWALIGLFGPAGAVVYLIIHRLIPTATEQSHHVSESGVDVEPPTPAT
jgi:hypothetical protein